jgi:hypothetical protein
MAHRINFNDKIIIIDGFAIYRGIAEETFSNPHILAYVKIGKNRKLILGRYIFQDTLEGKRKALMAVRGGIDSLHEAENTLLEEVLK